MPHIKRITTSAQFLQSFDAKLKMHFRVLRKDMIG